MNGKSIQFSNLHLESGHTFIIRSDTGEQATAYGFAGTSLTQPGKLSAVAYNGSAEISWQAVQGVSGYAIYVSTSENGAYDKVATLENTTSAIISGLVNGSTYYFKVIALYGQSVNAKAYFSINALAGSFFSVLPGYTFGEVTAVTPSDGVDKHSRVFKGSMKASSVRFIWDAVANAVNYHFYGAPEANGPYTLVEKVSDNMYDIELPIEHKYYKVSAEFVDDSEGPLSQYIYVQFKSSISWTIEGGIESVTVNVLNFSSFDNITLSCMGVGESEWVSTSVDKTPFTAGPL